MIRKMLSESFEKVIELLTIREEQLHEMTCTLQQFSQQIKTIEQLKSIEDFLFDQQWKEMHSKIRQTRSDCSWMSEVHCYSLFFIFIIFDRHACSLVHSTETDLYSGTISTH